MLSNSSILVLGAGELGMAVLRGLAARRKDDQSSDLAVLLRPESIHSTDSHRTSMIEELRALDIRLVAGDLQKNSEADLASIFQPFRTVIGCTGFAAGSQVQLKIARAVLAAKIERFVPWQFGVDYDVIGKGSSQELFDEQLEVRALLRAQHGTDWLIISTGIFTSFLFEPAFGVVDLERGLVHALGSWDNAVTVTTAEDIGRLTAAILHTEPSLKNQVIYTAGDTITYRQLADIVETVLVRKIQREQWTVRKLTAELARTPTESLQKYRLVFAEGRGVAWPKYRTFNEKNGILVTDVEEWLRRYTIRKPPENQS